MRLIRFRVTNFRSVADSGWLDVDEATALIGVNESGKTNLLLPLWKLNPARDGEIQPTSDFPKALFGQIRDAPGSHRFIEAEFDPGHDAARLADLAGMPVEGVTPVRVARFYDGRHEIAFPSDRRETEAPVAAIRALLDEGVARIGAATPLKSEAELHAQAQARLAELRKGLARTKTLDAAAVGALHDAVAELLPESPAKTSKLVPALTRLAGQLAAERDRIGRPDPASVEALRKAVLEALPPFVYYSNYGNLDSEIYLPHVVENLAREDLGAKEAAKARTLRVLFGFVGLEPQEILELGRDFKDIRAEAEAEVVRREGAQGFFKTLFRRGVSKATGGDAPGTEELARIAEAKRTRSILLQSAGTKLTDSFREWWKQGDYRFRFEADGNHFRIWVADDRRPQEIELENRSTGLQWFLSFFLVFVVESVGAHRRAVLLLDEPGQSLHPLAQRDLSAFFEGLAESNQLLYTAHSPFLVDADRLERARKVYVAGDGSTRVTGDLRETEGSDSQRGAAYAVHSALNLSVAEAMLWGCQPVVVGGTVDQLYLSAVKALLVAGRRISPAREIAFPPSGGVRIAKVVASMLSGQSEQLPAILLADDADGRAMAADLRAGLYAEAGRQVLDLAEITGMAGARAEDLFPPAFLADLLDRIERRPETRMADVVAEGRPFVDQAEAWAAGQGIALPEGWRVELARRAKLRALQRGPGAFEGDTVRTWKALFDSLTRLGAG